ncbi:MAG: hypothetical protein HXX80_06530 [Nitrososphaerales archaeon]|nr:hypothetical protein [Nitrososphaerales archaeon]
MGIPVHKKEFTIPTKIGDSLRVRIEKVGAGWDRERIHLIYRIIRGEDRRHYPADSVALYLEELEAIAKCLDLKYLEKEMPD